MDTVLGNRIIALKSVIAAKFDMENWEEIALLTDTASILDGHARLYRSMSFGDDDYSGCVLAVLRQIAEKSPYAFKQIEAYVDNKFGDGGTFISAKPSERRITFAPSVFSIPDGDVERDLVTVMMPFAMEFDGVYQAIQKASKLNGLRCVRADDVWRESIIMQDVFDLIYKAEVVIVDFTGKNPNVMYETGIAHALGKHVVPISQSIEDVPSDLRHHRFQKYLGNKEGLASLASKLTEKLSSHRIAPSPAVSDDDKIPF